MENIFDSGTFSLIILPILIFLARIADVTFGTIRIIFVSRGMKWLAPVFGFFEIIIWLFAIGQVFGNLTNITLPEMNISEIIENCQMQLFNFEDIKERNKNNDLIEKIKFFHLD